jgi:hypothetical protein
MRTDSTTGFLVEFVAGFLVEFVAGFLVGLSAAAAHLDNSREPGTQGARDA